MSPNTNMKCVGSITCTLVLFCIISTESRFGRNEYHGGNTVYRGVLGCGETATGSVIYDPPYSQSAYQSFTIPVINCTVNISTCFNNTLNISAPEEVQARAIGLALFVIDLDMDFLDWDDVDQTDRNCGLNGEYVNEDLSQYNGDQNVSCNGSIDGLLLVRVATVGDQGSANYTIRLDCSADCTVCPVDPELDQLQQIEDVKNCVEFDESQEDEAGDSFDSMRFVEGRYGENGRGSASYSDSNENVRARSDLERMDENEEVFQYEDEDEKQDTNHVEREFMIQFSHSFWIKFYALLAVMMMGCGLCVFCNGKRKQ